MQERNDTYIREWTHDGRPSLNRMGIPPADGPWMSEPDKVHWIDPATDLDCLAVRNHFGAWCGYVGLPPGHPHHGAGYETPEVEVHGGLTFADSCRESDEGEGHGICHVPLPGRPHDVWWLGFDCAHAFDLTPYNASDPWYREQSWHRDDVYRDLDYVKAECASLAKQLASVQS